MLKILQARLQQHVNRELPDVQAGFRRGRRTRDCQHPLGHRKSNVIPKNIPTSVSLTMSMPLTVWITVNVENSERDGNTRPPDLPLEKSVCRSGSNSKNWT